MIDRISGGNIRVFGMFFLRISLKRPNKVGQYIIVAVVVLVIISLAPPAAESALLIVLHPVCFKATTDEYRRYR